MMMVHSRIPSGIQKIKYQHFFHVDDEMIATFFFFIFVSLIFSIRGRSRDNKMMNERFDQYIEPLHNIELM